MKPYYQDNYVTIYHGDCREILPELPKVDLVLTDPPYGIGFEYISYDDTYENWVELMNFIIPYCKSLAQMSIISGRTKNLPFFYQNFPPDWIICWYKGSVSHQSPIGFSVWEPLVVYGKPIKRTMEDYVFCSPISFNGKHPCPKPEGWALKLISKATQVNDLILDPFLGSGTTAYCAKKLNRKCIGIEIEEKYCEIAAKRCSQGVMELRV